MLEADLIQVWAHDLSVEPGRTYRYRLAVNVYNPFFGRKRSLVESQEALAELFTLSSAVSEWSTPIRIHPPLRVFITQASVNSGGPLRLGRAKAEVYRFYDGRQWRATFNVPPSTGGPTRSAASPAESPDELPAEHPAELPV